MKAPIAKLLLPSFIGLLRRAPKPKARGRGGILIFKPDRIGDFVLAAECMRQIRDHFSPVPCSVVMSELLLPIARRELGNVSLLSLPVSNGSFFLSLFKAWHWGRKHLAPIEWDTLVNLRYHLTLREDLVLMSVRANHSYGVGRGLNVNSWPDSLSSFRPKNEIAYPRGCSETPSEFLAHERLLSVLGCGSAPYKPRLHSWGGEGGDYLLLSPFGSESIRSYPADLLAEAFSQANLPANLHIKICVELSRLREGRRLLQKCSERISATFEIVTPKDIMSFIDCVASSKAVVAMESAAAHIAIALGKPGVFVVGGGHYGAFAPWALNTDQHWITNQLPCFGCDWQCVRAEPECVSGIAPGLIAEKIAVSVSRQKSGGE